MFGNYTQQHNGYEHGETVTLDNFLNDVQVQYQFNCFVFFLSLGRLHWFLLCVFGAIMKPVISEAIRGNPTWYFITLGVC